MAAPAITASDLAAVRDAIGFASRSRPKDATDAQQRISDPTARKLVEWAILRSRAEAMLWEGRADLATIRALTDDQPVSAKGRFALGRALLAQGDRAGAQALIRDAWRTEPMQFDAEEEILETFGDLITQADDKARMEHWLYANDTNAALRAAIRLGGNERRVRRLVRLDPDSGRIVALQQMTLWARTRISRCKKGAACAFTFGFLSMYALH